MFRWKCYLIWAASLSILAFKTIYGNIYSISSAQAVLTPSSVLNREKVESIILKQLYIQFCLDFGV